MANFTAQDIDVTVTFDSDQNRVKVTSNNDFSLYDNMPLITLKGLGQLNDPFSNIVFQKLSTSSPLIDLAIGNTISAWYSLPETTSGDILNGVYSFSYTVNQTGVASNLVVASITTTTQEAELPGDRSYLVAGDVVTFSGSSNVGNNGVKTVVSSVYDSLLDVTTVTFEAASFTNNESGLDGTLAAINVVHTFVKNVTYTYTGCEEVTPTADVTFDCESTQFGSITFQDTTTLPSGQSLSLRTFVVSYPGNLTDPPTPSDVQTTLPSITISNLATGTWTYRLTYNVTVVQNDDLVVTYESTSGAVEFVVSCSGTLCGLTDCINNLYKKHYAALKSGGVSPYQKYVDAVVLNYVLAKEYQKCGDQEKYRNAVQTIEDAIDASGCDCDCCDDNGNQWINNAGFESQSLIEQIYNQITLLSTIIEDNAQATADYNAIVAQMNAIYAESLQLVSELGVIEAQASSLNGFEDNFDDLVDVLEANTTTVISDVSGVISDLNTLLTDIATFNTNYPDYTSYFTSVIVQYNAIDATLNQIDTQANDLLTLLQSLTPINFNALIQDVLDDIADIQDDLEAITITQTNIINTLVGIQQILDLLTVQVIQNTSDIAALQWGEGIDEIYSAQSDVDITYVPGSVPAEYPIPGQYFAGANGQKGYIQFRIDFENLVNPFFVRVVNETTSVGIWQSPSFSAGTQGSIDIILKYVSSNNFVMAGSVTDILSGTTTLTNVVTTGITETDILLGQTNSLRVVSNDTNTYFYRIEMIGIKVQ